MGSQQHDSAWRPIFTGALGERAGEVIQAIADRLHQVPADWVPEGMPKLFRNGAANNPSLAGGRAGLATFYAYLAQTGAREPNQQRALQLLDDAVDLTARTSLRASLYAGFTGVAWATEYVQRVLLEHSEEDPNAAIDEALVEYVSHSPWQAEYDLVYGLVGFGVYALERLPRATAVQCLEQVIDRFDETAERGPEGITWRTIPELLPPHQRAMAPQGYYNLGVAHGVPAVIALLAEAGAAGVAHEKAQHLLDGAVPWLLARRLPDGAPACFPYWIGPGLEASAARLAWCYGDPGIAATLLLAARRVGHAGWEREAVELARRAAQRRPEDSGVLDGGLCHGAAGVAHLFNRLYQATGDEQLGDAARLWFEHTLALRRDQQGMAGFAAWMAAPDGEQSWVADPYLLTGAAGIGLALLAATSEVEPTWDRVLLVSIPPKPG
jgi:lantibiotic modifying enzyme